jgi:uncharacterized protein YgiM (DUF1202 family)
VAAENPAVAKDDPELRARAIPAAAVASGTVSSAASEGSETMQEATALPGSTGTVSAARPTETLGIVAARGAAAVVPAPSLLDQRAVPENATRAIRFEGRTSRASSQDVTTQPLQTTTQSILTPQQQIRRVNGDLVNLRAGPGTSHAVVGQLPRGAAVEVLRDNGAGWIRLRPVNGGPEGWIADFLLTRG